MLCACLAVPTGVATSVLGRGASHSHRHAISLRACWWSGKPRTSEMIQQKQKEKAAGKDDYQEENKEAPGKANPVHGTTGQVPVQINPSTDIPNSDCCQCHMQT